jgi:hypothetical protein
MGHACHRRVLTLIAALAAIPLLPACESAQAAQEAPVYVWTGTAPSGACTSNRVVVLSANGDAYCCTGTTWSLCNDSHPDEVPVTSHILQGNGSGLAQAWAGSTCSSGYYSQGTSGGGTTSCTNTGLDASVLSTGTLGVARGGTNVTSAVDDTLMVGNGTTWQGSALPATPCTNSQKLQYTNSTNAWSCAGGITAAGVPALSSLPVLPDANYPAGALIYLTTDKKLYRSDGSAWIKATDGADITARTIGADRLVADSITAGEISASAIGASEIAAGAITADKISANVISVSQLVQNYGDNLWPNGTSEIDPPTGAPQSVLDSAEFTHRSTSAAYSGNYGRRITSLEILSSETGCYPGDKYFFELALRKTSGGFVDLRIDFYVSGSWQTGFPVQISADSSTFSYYEVKATAPANSTTVRFVIRALSNTPVVDVDNIYSRRQIVSDDIANATINTIHLTDGSVENNKIDVNAGPIHPQIGSITNTSNSTWYNVYIHELRGATALDEGMVVRGTLITESSGASTGVWLRFRLSDTNRKGSCEVRYWDGYTAGSTWFTLDTTGYILSPGTSSGTTPVPFSYICGITTTATSGYTYLYIEVRSEVSGQAVHIRDGSDYAISYDR